MERTPLELLRDFEFFAEKYFYITIKSSNVNQISATIPFKLNYGQRFIHQKLELQLRETGKVRAIILKGRQIGCSTLIQARYFHKVITRVGQKAYIMAHKEDATNNIFNITKTYLDNLPAGLCPKPTKENTSEIYFKQFESGYKTGTAGSVAIGRSQTNQLLHGSEIGFWANTDHHAAGIMQTVADMAGTEIILESTANGIGNFFHREWMAAISGQSEYMPIFVPWYWMPEYTSNAVDITLNDEEKEFLAIFSQDGLTIEHLAWRRNKTINLNKDPEKGANMFKQEYPFTSTEAFLNPIGRIFIPAKYVNKARLNRVESEVGIIIGVDPADDKDGSDRTAIICRSGRRAFNLQTFKNHNTMNICGVLVKMIEQYQPVKVYIDCIGIGKGIVDRMQEMGYSMCEGINVATDADEKERYQDKRAELWDRCLDWLMQPMPVEIPDSDEIQGDLCSVGFEYDSNGRLRIESKKDLKKRGMPSPDTADALLHTFSGGFYESAAAIPVRRIHPSHQKGFY